MVYPGLSPLHHKKRLVREVVKGSVSGQLESGRGTVSGICDGDPHSCVSDRTAGSKGSTTFVLMDV